MIRSIFAVLWFTAIATQPALTWAQAQAPAQPGPARITLDQIPRVYGLAVASSNPVRLHLATPMGLYLAAPGGEATVFAGVQGHLMGYAVHPANQRHMIAGGHVGRSGSIGVLLSSNGGKSWKQISENAAGHVGFHILEFSKADPNVIYGVTNGLRVSEDGGHNWREVGALPLELVHFDTSAKQVKTLYAATKAGLMISRDQGAGWQRAPGLPTGIASMVHVTPKGQVYVFVIGAGLYSASEPGLEWRQLSGGFSDRIMLRMATDPANPRRLYAATVIGAVVTSGDGGGSWLGFEGSHNATAEIIGKGRKLFNTYCQACHGADAKGQQTTPGFDPKNPPSIMAPPLDDTAHGWHHSDANLASTILNGSPRQGSPMVAWKAQLSKADAESLVAYIKSLWSFRSIACQGARHMSCMRHRQRR